jgi:hypothetical protein
MKVSTNTTVDIGFTEEEKAILTKAQELLSSVGNKLWQNDNDDIADLSYLFTDTASNIKNIITGDY